MAAAISLADLCFAAMKSNSTFTSEAVNAKGAGSKESHNKAALPDDNGGVRAIQWSGTCSNMPSEFLGHSEFLLLGFKACRSSAGIASKATLFSSRGRPQQRLAFLSVVKTKIKQKMKDTITLRIGKSHRLKTHEHF